MKISLEQPGSMVVRSVSATEIRIADECFARPVAVTAKSVLGAWADKPIADLTAADFADLLATEPEIIVLGTGKAIRFAPRELVFALARRGIGFEVMDTRAAARTFNVLIAEGRQVAAVLYID